MTDQDEIDRLKDSQNGRLFVPTQSEIAQRAAAIQSTWTPEQRANRLGDRGTGEHYDPTTQSAALAMLAVKLAAKRQQFDHHNDKRKN